ncbi:tRNA 2-thiocytidine(32) synthetase TtcA [Notoacmeibacter ruber]|uniref:tRNA-cytidine(32) 2-sulfurtransferase n=1 Tax=Notoacmeibacter ruber TaxID=2670375 RepID=A0A3L7JBR2_9HYPH|nr:tRNA 2-thiocytidine(32) synthetase TtcA [Notoacmeibacter ruber]RLQ88076.1 tRNA 2-thiocytidine(32) synthetase TtcA [Notoacmeibacter ruber]
MSIATHESSVEASELPPLFRDAPTSVEFNKLRKRLIRQIRQVMDDYGMIRPGERWLVALSGGKDSYGLLALLLDLKWRGLLPVELLACNLDQGQPNFPKHILPDWLSANGVPHRIEYRDTYSIVTDKLSDNATYCSLCSRLRRGHLYRIAREEGCSALVLGHHREDILETFFMNLFHGGRLAAMPPKLLNDDGDVEVLRPLAFCAEADMTKLADALLFPIIPCDLCGSQDGLQRNAMKVMIEDIERRMPGRKDTMIRAMANIRPSQMLDRSLFDFAGLAAATVQDPTADPAE